MRDVHSLFRTDDAARPGEPSPSVAAVEVVTPASPPMHAAPSPDRAVGAWLALLIFTVYLLGYSGLFHSIDEQASLAVTETLLAEGAWHTNQMAWEQVWEPSQNAFGVDGNLYSKKGLAVPLLALPLFALGKGVDGVGAVQIAVLLGPIVSAVTAYLVYVLARRLGYGRATAVLAAGVWAFGTLAWPYARTLFSEPVGALGLALALYAAVCYRRTGPPVGEGQWRPLLLCGVGLALLVLSRPANGVVALPFGLYWLYVLFAERRLHRTRPIPWRSAVMEGLALSAPVAAVVGLFTWHSLTAFGRLLGHPLDAVEGFTTPFVVGLIGLLVSPGKGLLWYVPLIGLIVPSMWWIGQEKQGHRADFLLAGAAVMVPLLFYSTWWDWPGGTAWGPRLIVMTTPALVVLALPALERLVRPRRRWHRIAIGGVLLLSLIVQLPGVLVNTAVQEGWDHYIGISRAQRLWHWRYSPLFSQSRTLVTEWATEPIWFQPFLWRQPAALLGLLVGSAIAAVGLTTAGLQQAWRVRNRPLLGAAAVLALVLWMGALVTVAAPDPRWHEKSAEPEDNRALWDWLAVEGRDGDVVVVDMLLYYDVIGRTAAWMNAAPAPPAYVGWIRTPPPDGASPVTPLPLADWLPGYERVWLSLEMTPPHAPDSTTEAWLDGWAYRGRQIWFGTQRLVEYFVPPTDETAPPAASAPYRFGETLTLLGHQVRSGKRPDVRLVDLSWQQPPSADLRYSVQVLDENGRLLDQRDRVLSSHAGRVGLTVPDAPHSLILKVYDPATSAPLPVINAEDVLIGEYVVLAEQREQGQE